MGLQTRSSRAADQGDCLPPFTKESRGLPAKWKVRAFLKVKMAVVPGRNVEWLKKR